MKQLLIFLGIFFISSCSHEKVDDSPAQVLAKSNFDSATMTTELQRLMAQYGITKYGLVIYDKKSRLIFLEFKGGHRFNKLIPVGSATKWVTAVTILRIIEKTGNNFTLQTEIQDILKDGEWNGKLVGKVSLNLLLSFRSGIRKDRIIPCTAKERISLERCVTLILKSNLDDQNFDTSQSFNYGPVHMAVAGRMTEVALGGKLWKDIFRDEIVKTFNMNENTLYYTKPAQGDGEGQTNPLLAGGLKITTKDYAKLLTMVYNLGRYRGQQFLSRDIVENELLRDQFTRRPRTRIIYSPFKQKLGKRFHYALGNWIERENYVSKYHSSSPGIFGFYPWIDKRRRYYAILSLYEKDDRDISKKSYEIVEKLRPEIIKRLIH